MEGFRVEVHFTEIDPTIVYNNATKEGLIICKRETQWGLVTPRNNLGCRIPVYVKHTSHVIFQYVVRKRESKDKHSWSVFLAYALSVYDGCGHMKWKALYHLTLHFTQRIGN